MVPNMNQGQIFAILSTPTLRTKLSVFVPRNVGDRRLG